jgi:hypothetical protein
MIVESAPLESIFGSSACDSLEDADADVVQQAIGKMPIVGQGTYVVECTFKGRATVDGRQLLQGTMTMYQGPQGTKSQTYYGSFVAPVTMYNRLEAELDDLSGMPFPGVATCKWHTSEGKRATLITEAAVSTSGLRETYKGQFSQGHATGNGTTIARAVGAAAAAAARPAQTLVVTAVSAVSAVCPDVRAHREWRHTGSYLAQKFHGPGTFVATDGTRHVGRFEHGHLHDPNAQSEAACGSTYVGPFVQGLRHGRGVCTDARGSVAMVVYSRGAVVQMDSLPRPPVRTTLARAARAAGSTENLQALQRRRASKDALKLAMDTLDGFAEQSDAVDAAGKCKTASITEGAYLELAARLRDVFWSMEAGESDDAAASAIASAGEGEGEGEGNSDSDSDSDSDSEGDSDSESESESETGESETGETGEDHESESESESHLLNS